MPEIQLNKPLYKQGAAAGETSTSGPPPPRAPKPSTAARVGAVLMDALALYGAMLLIIRLAPDLIIGLGWMGPVLGLLLGWLYLTVGGSHLCLGRTLGKLVMRVQLCDVAGPDLPLGRSAARAAMLISPLALFIVSGYVHEKYDQPEILAPMPFIQVFAPLLAFGWLAANLFHAVFDSHGRTLYDRIVASLVVNAEPDPDQLQEFLRSARAPLSPQDLRKPRIAFAVVAALFLAMGSFRYFEFKSHIRNLPAKDLREFTASRRAYFVPGFGQPLPAAPGGQAMVDNDTTTSLQMEQAAFEYRRRAVFTADDVRENREAMTALDRIIQAHSGSDFQDRLFAHLNELNKKRILRGEGATTAPQRLKFEVTFAKQADLFFARESVPVLTETRTVRVDPGDPATSTPITIRTDGP